MWTEDTAGAGERAARMRWQSSDGSARVVEGGARRAGAGMDEWREGRGAWGGGGGGSGRRGGGAGGRTGPMELSGRAAGACEAQKEGGLGGER